MQKIKDINCPKMDYDENDKHKLKANSERDILCFFWCGFIWHLKKDKIKLNY